MKSRIATLKETKALKGRALRCAIRAAMERMEFHPKSGHRKPTRIGLRKAGTA